MKAIITKCKLTALVKFFMVLGFAAFTASAYAEYYAAYYGQPNVIELNRPYPVHHRYRHHVTRHHTYYRYRNNPSISVYYVWQGYPCCGGCDGCGQWNAVYMQRSVDNDFYYSPDSFNETQMYDDDRSYNPDLTTGDDDTWQNPGMDIDN